MRLLKYLWLLVLIALAITWSIVLRPDFLGGPASYIIVSGESMEPALRSGDLAVLRKQEDYHPGDVVAFAVGGGDAVIHRIVGGDAEEGFRTQGDNQERPDLWRPTPDDIGGSMWFSIPGGGRVITYLQQPVLLALIAGIGSLGLFGSRRRRRRRARHLYERPRRKQRATNGDFSLRGAGPMLLILATLTLVVGGGTLFMLLQPEKRVVTSERTRYEHAGEFRYTATVTPSVVYESATVESPPDGSPGPPIYTSLLRNLRVDFDYALKAEGPAQVEGDISAYLSISAGEGGWTRTLSLLDSSPFEGTSASAGFHVDIDRIRSLIAVAEEQTGFSPSRYQLAVVARIDVSGEVEGPVDEVFLAELPMELGSTLLSIDENLVVSEVVTEPEQVIVANHLELVGLSVPVGLGRAVLWTTLAMLLVAGGGYALAVRRSLGRGPVAWIRLRYGPLIVPVTGTSPDQARPVEVTSISDLVRLAKGAEQMVFYDQPGPGEHRFFVPDGPVTYEYRVTGPRKEGAG